MPDGEARSRPELRYRHARKSKDPLLWAADILTSATAHDLTSRDRPHQPLLASATLRLERLKA
ncbi:MAG: hypothetical protein ACKVWR_07695 [Acidimicrobiales bacterium]